MHKTTIVPGIFVKLVNEGLCSNRCMITCCHLANRLALPVMILVHWTRHFVKVNVSKVNIFYGIVLILVVPFDVHFNYIDDAFT